MNIGPDIRRERLVASLAVVSDGLREEVHRIAAAADRVVEEQDLLVGSASMRSVWESSDLFLLDTVTAREALSAGLPRRRGVVVLSESPLALEDWRTATTLGAEHALALPWDEDTLVRVLGEPYEMNTGGGVVVVVGACGGAGASTFAAALALSGDRTHDRTLLVDGDRFGSGLDLLLGWEDEPGLRWSGLVVEGGRVSADALHSALPSSQGLSVLALGRTGADRAGLSAVAASAVVDAGRTCGDLVVCDAPRHPDEVGDVLYEAADLVVIVVPADLRAVAAAESVAEYAGVRNANVGVIVRGPAPGGLRGPDIARALSLPLLAAMRPEPRLADRIERGGLVLGRRSPLAAAARTVLDTFAQKPGARRWAA